MSVLNFPTCPSDCSGSLPAIDFDLCAPELHYGEISHIYVATAAAAAFANVELLGEWSTRLSEAGVDPDAIRELVVMGDLPEPEQTEITISGDRRVIGFKTFAINFDIDETNDVNYYWLMNQECSFQNRIWYRTADGLLYGGNTGILATIRMNQIIPRERTEIVKFTGTVVWKSQFSPLRTVFPLV